MTLPSRPISRTSRAHATIRQGMLQRLLADWDPETVRRRMHARRLDKDVLGAWARNVRPESQHIWEAKAGAEPARGP